MITLPEPPHCCERKSCGFSTEINQCNILQYKKIREVLQYYEAVIFINRASSQMSVNSRGSHVDVFAHSWFEDFRLVLCFCFSWSRSLRSLFLLFLCFLLSLGCNLNTHSVTSTARHENNNIHAHKCWPVHRLPHTDPQILKRSATLSQTENVKQKQRFRLRKNTLDLLACCYRLRNEKAKEKKKYWSEVFKNSVASS